MRCYWVYILTNDSRTLYVGVTNNLAKRVYEHREKLIDGFTKRYNIAQLVCYEETNDVKAAIAREKEIKGWTRQKKFALVNSFNPKWRDLGDEVLGLMQ